MNTTATEATSVEIKMKDDGIEWLCYKLNFLLGLGFYLQAASSHRLAVKQLGICQVSQRQSDVIEFNWGLSCISVINMYCCLRELMKQQSTTG